MPDELVANQPHSVQLQQKRKLWSIVGLNLGSIVGTGIFISLAIATGIAGSAVLFAIGLAALVAACNGLSQSQLAVSGLPSASVAASDRPLRTCWLSFIADWALLCAKVMSAATAAMGLAGYLLNAIAPNLPTLLLPTALVAILAASAIASTTTHRPIALIRLSLGIVLCSLLFFAGTGLPSAITASSRTLLPVFGSFSPSGSPLVAILRAIALMVVAYAGYEPSSIALTQNSSSRRSSPEAMVISLLLTMLLYVSVAGVGIGAVGASSFRDAIDLQVAPLAVVANQFAGATGAVVLSVGAVVALFNILLKLMVEMPQLLLLLGQRQDAPWLVARLSRRAPRSAAGIAISGAIATLVSITLVFINEVALTWSLATFALLIHGAIAHLAVLRLAASERLYPRWLAWVGLCTCLGLCLSLEWRLWMSGLGFLAIALTWRGMTQWMNEQN